jgi:hypothetical protein
LCWRHKNCAADQLTQKPVIAIWCMLSFTHFSTISIQSRLSCSSLQHFLSSLYRSKSCNQYTVKDHCVHHTPEHKCSYTAKHLSPPILQIYHHIITIHSVFVLRHLYINTLRTGDANLRLLRYNCERRMMQNCLLTRNWFLHT